MVTQKRTPLQQVQSMRQELAEIRRQAAARKKNAAKAAAKPKHKTPRIRTPEERNRQVREAIGCATDASQFARAVNGGEFERAKRQRDSIIARLRRIPL